MTGLHIALAFLAPLTIGAFLGAAGMRWWMTRDRSTWLRSADVLTYARGTRDRDRAALDAARGSSSWWRGA